MHSRRAHSHHHRILRARVCCALASLLAHFSFVFLPLTLPLPPLSAHRSLKTYLEKYDLSEYMKLLLSADCAEGLAYLSNKVKGQKRKKKQSLTVMCLRSRTTDPLAHSVYLCKGFIHRDVAARNMLVSSLKRAKISDVRCLLPLCLLNFCCPPG
jgi:hypothetical protein